MRVRQGVLEFRFKEFFGRAAMPDLASCQGQGVQISITARWSIGALLLAGLVAAATNAIAGPLDFPAASLTPRSQPGWDAAPNHLDLSAPPDEAQRGKTEIETPIGRRIEDCFPA